MPSRIAGVKEVMARHQSENKSNAQRDEEHVAHSTITMTMRYAHLAPGGADPDSRAGVAGRGNQVATGRRLIGFAVENPQLR